MNQRPVKHFLQETHHPLLKHPELQWISARELLSRIETSARRPEIPSKPRAIVFDLDSTLFCTGPRLKSILIRYVHEFRDLDPVWMKVVHDLESLHQRYSVPETLFHLLNRYRSSEESEAMVKAFWPRFEKSWKEEFFLSRNMTVDVPYEGAVDFVKRTVEMGYSPIYLTGRDFERGMDGTRHALRRWGYPLGPDTHTILKPDRTMKDMEFKRGIARTLNARFDIHFVLDNEPENLAMFAAMIPGSEIVFFHSIMSRRWSTDTLTRDLAGRKVLGIKSFEI